MKLALIPLMAFFLQAGGRGTIQGRVVRAGSGEGVVGARVLITKMNGLLSDSRYLVTDELGAFEIRDVPAGTYRAFAQSDGYVRNETSSPLTITNGQSVRDLVFSLVPNGVITGRVTDQNNEPISRIYVRATDDNKKIYETQTNDLGEYRLFDLAPGNYSLSVTRYTAPYIEGARYIVPTPPRLDSFGEGQSLNTLTNFLSNGGYIDPRALNPTSPPGALPRVVEVPAGAVVTAVDFRY